MSPSFTSVSVVFTMRVFVPTRTICEVVASEAPGDGWPCERSTAAIVIEPSFTARTRPTTACWAAPAPPWPKAARPPLPPRAPVVPVVAAEPVVVGVWAPA